MFRPYSLGLAMVYCLSYYGGKGLVMFRDLTLDPLSVVGGH
jgi:hypothetical protein